MTSKGAWELLHNDDATSASFQICANKLLIICKTDVQLARLVEQRARQTCKWLLHAVPTYKRYEYRNITEQSTLAASTPPSRLVLRTNAQHYSSWSSQGNYDEQRVDNSWDELFTSMNNSWDELFMGYRALDTVTFTYVNKTCKWWMQAVPHVLTNKGEHEIDQHRSTSTESAMEAGYQVVYTRLSANDLTVLATIRRPHERCMKMHW